MVLPHPDPSDVRREEYAHLEAPLKAIAEVHPEQTGTSLNLMREKQSRDVSEVNRQAGACAAHTCLCCPYWS